MPCRSLFSTFTVCVSLFIPRCIAGAHVVMLDAFSPETVIPVLLDKKNLACTLFMAVPSMYARMLDAVGDKTLDFGHIRLWTSGSAPLLVKDFERIKTNFRQRACGARGHV